MDKLNKFVANHGERAGRIINILAKQAKFKKALETEVGQEIFSDVLISMESLLEKIIIETATKEEKADFRALRMIAERWQDKLADYNKTILQIAKEQTK